MISINIIFFLTGIISYILFKKYFNKKKNKYIKISPIIENKKFSNVSDNILREQLDRNYLFFGDEGMNLIKNSSVVVFNCETIGSNISVTLARSGVKQLILIDNNKLTVGNYKYHPFAVCEDINKDNLDILSNYIKQINPNIDLILIKEQIDFDNLDTYFHEKKINYIVDSIKKENIIEKCKLIKYATSNNINIISAYNPSSYQNDPTQIRFSKISLAENSEITELFLKNYKKLYNSNIPDFNIVYSKQEKNEKVKKSENLFCYGVISDTATSIILCDLAKFKRDESKEKEEKRKEEIKLASKTLSEAIEDYKKDEIEKKKTEPKYLSVLSYDDFRSICIGFKNGSCLKQKPTSKMRFVRWRLYKEPARNNIVIMGKSEINLHLKIRNEEELIKYYTKPVVDRIDNILNSI